MQDVSSLSNVLLWSYAAYMMLGYPVSITLFQFELNGHSMLQAAAILR